MSAKKQRKVLELLDFTAFLWYNSFMKNTANVQTSNTEMVSISRAEYERFQAQGERISALEKQVEQLMEAIRLSRKKLFGSSSEKMSGNGYEQMSLLFNEAEAYLSVPEKNETTSVAAHTRQKRSSKLEEVLPEDVPVEIVEHRISTEDLECPFCGSEMIEIGKEVRRSLVMIPAQVKIREDWYYTYACKTCKEENIETPVAKTEKEPSVIPGSYASAEAIAHIMVQKFVMGSPLYRQEQEWNRQGVKLSRQTMSNWILRAAEDWLKPVYEELHRKLVQHKVLHADETTLQVLREPWKSAQSKSYMWLYRTSGDAEHPIVLYEYSPNRKPKNAEEFLEDFKGWLHADGYPGYHSLPEQIRVVGCWAHARRKFDEAVNSLPKQEQAGSAALEGQRYCNALFALEKELAGLTGEKRYKQRQERAKPILDALLAWAETKKAPPKSALGKALHYLREQWPWLIRYLEDGRLEISNNRAERSIKPFVMDRKNFLFANTPNGAQGSAIIFSMIETAKENGLDPFHYLVWVLQSTPGMNKTAPDWAAALMPENAPKICFAGNRD